MKIKQKIVKTKYLFIIAATLFMYSCGGDSATVEGDDATQQLKAKSESDDRDLTTVGNNLLELGLEYKNITLNKSAATRSIQTISKGWSIDELYFLENGDTIIHKNQLVVYPEKNGVKDLHTLPDTLEIQWVRAIKVLADEADILQVDLQENDSGKKREALIALSGPFLWGEILHITQEAE